MTESGFEFLGAAPVQAESTVEFVIQQSSDEQRCFFPVPFGVAGSIAGPSENLHNWSWEVEIPQGASFMKVIWDPRGTKSMQWAYLDVFGDRLSLSETARDQKK